MIRSPVRVLRLVIIKFSHPRDYLNKRQRLNAIRVVVEHTTCYLTSFNKLLDNNVPAITKRLVKRRKNISVCPNYHSTDARTAIRRFYNKRKSDKTRNFLIKNITIFLPLALIKSKKFRNSHSGVLQ